MNLPWRQECPKSKKNERILDILAMIFIEILHFLKKNIQNADKND